MAFRRNCCAARSAGGHLSRAVNASVPSLVRLGKLLLLGRGPSERLRLREVERALLIRALLSVPGSLVVVLLLEPRRDLRRGLPGLAEVTQPLAREVFERAS